MKLITLNYHISPQNLWGITVDFMSVSILDGEIQRLRSIVSSKRVGKVIFLADSFRIGLRGLNPCKSMQSLNENNAEIFENFIGAFYVHRRPTQHYTPTSLTLALQDCNENLS